MFVKQYVTLLQILYGDVQSVKNYFKRRCFQVKLYNVRAANQRNQLREVITPLERVNGNIPVATVAIQASNRTQRRLKAKMERQGKA
ncbi:hypothetical protein EAD10_20505 [Salmonella enterica]|nr:hypothetical protein [Salmonella enterica subsp. enterica]EAP3270665.1 hypothetical protein [Salmonella enterica]EAS8607844.1 hypothetical protein [Salmonella enterica]EAU7059949.1 hypothetical protein [Salmonella enterica]ECE7004771.1 hypothetical protein [Salmonella enterica subsp. enterica]